MPPFAVISSQRTRLHLDAAQSRFGVAVHSRVPCFLWRRVWASAGRCAGKRLYTLASMAVSTRPGDIAEWLPRMKGYEDHLGWMDETMRKGPTGPITRPVPSVAHMHSGTSCRQRICQVPSMAQWAFASSCPSNISTYGADGDGDGRVDLFTVPDAGGQPCKTIFTGNGWRAAGTGKSSTSC